MSLDKRIEEEDSTTDEEKAAKKRADIKAKAVAAWDQRRRKVNRALRAGASPKSQEGAYEGLVNPDALPEQIEFIKTFLEGGETYDPQRQKHRRQRIKNKKRARQRMQPRLKGITKPRHPKGTHKQIEDFLASQEEEAVDEGIKKSSSPVKKSYYGSGYRAGGKKVKMGEIPAMWPLWGMPPSPEVIAKIKQLRANRAKKLKEGHNQDDPHLGPIPADFSYHWPVNKRHREKMAREREQEEFARLKAETDHLPQTGYKRMTSRRPMAYEKPKKGLLDRVKALLTRKNK